CARGEITISGVDIKLTNDGFDFW
nr:immunoglobulin heavy chain junction region [Macaca mulatta]